MGCGGESRELLELERLAFVPPAAFKLAISNDPNLNLSIRRAIVIDRFELTRRDQLLYLDEPPAPMSERTGLRVEGDTELEGFTADRLDWPAFLTFDEAEDIAARRGMRLPRAKEWIHVALGRKPVRYPWGVRRGRFANTSEVELGRPVPVGTFENGRVEPFACYDMYGNVWEWVADEAPSMHVHPENLVGEITSVMGGGFDSSIDDGLYSSYAQSIGFNARSVPRNTLNPAYGVRMCAEADEYLWTKASSWSRGRDARVRVAAVARRWAEDAVARDALRALLDDLCGRDGAPSELRWLREGLPRAEVAAETEGEG